MYKSSYNKIYMYEHICHNDFSLDLEDYKQNNGVATNIFCLGVIVHQKSLSFYKN